MYQALYRKYRPAKLDEIYGQNTIIKVIKNSILQNKISHAYLFTGPRGTGKTSVAKIFSKIINCENKNNYDACGKCKSCTEKNNNDIIEIDAASNNGVDEIREIKNKIDLVPANGKYKIYIVDEVHMLTIGAFNALLKTLEEPPSHAVFILATTEPHKIPETILSRCQRFDFKKINNQSIKERLKEISQKENITINEEALIEIARICDGGMRDSVNMLDQLTLLTNKEITVENVHELNGTLREKELESFISNIYCGKTDEIFKKIDDFDQKGKNFAKIIEQIISLLKEILIFKEAPKYFSEKKNENVNFSEEIKKMNEQIIINYIEELNKSLNQEKNTTNKKLVFEILIIKLLQTNVCIEGVKDNQENKQLKIKNKEKETTKETPKEKIKEKNKISGEQIEQIKKIRVNNTLAGFSKKLTNQINSKIASLNEYLIDSSQRKYISIILDGKLKAASMQNLIFVYKTKRESDNFNQKVIEIEKIIKNFLNQEYKIVSVDEEEWEKIKQEFNSQKKKYTYITENIKIEKNTINQKMSDFNDIIEYK